ncbi:MAG: hypothetical protein KJ077_30055 [Anaerolineae bacterium]|nr:hypothetical protein [Anaerolineae bacterium]
MKKRSSFIYWAFDLLALLLIGVMLLSYYFHLSLFWEEALTIIVIVVVYGVIILWWRANPTAMVEPDKVKQADEPGGAKRGHYLTEAQTHYWQVHRMNSKRKL